MFRTKFNFQSIIGILLFIIGISAIALAIVVTPTFVNNYFPLDDNIILERIQQLNGYRFISSIFGILLIISGSILMIVKNLETKLQQVIANINILIIDPNRFKRAKFVLVALIIGLIGISAFLLIFLAPVATMTITITLTIYLLLGFSYYGWGTVLCIILRNDKKSSDNVILPIWLGWAFTLFLFQILHFIFSINAYVVIPIFLLGVAVSIPQLIKDLKNIFRHPKPLLSPRIIETVFILFFVGVSAWVASRSMRAPTVYDSALYYSNAIRWINSYPIIPGLGNLHGRLAFNQSFFVSVAALNFYPFFGFGRSIANSFLLLVLIGQIFISLRSAISLPSFLTTHPFHYAPDFLIIPMIAYLALKSDGLASPTPDFTSTLLQFSIFVEFTHAIAEWLDGRRNQDFRAFFISILSATAVTVKLSNLGFSAVMIGIVIVYIWKTYLPLIRGLVRWILPIVFIVFVWVISGYILSGAPLYPSTLGYVPVEWAVPKAAVINEANWVYSWARQPSATPSSVLGNWNWIKPWLFGIFNSKTYLVEMVYPLIIFLVCGFITIIALFFLRKLTRPRFLEWIIFLPLLTGLIYWFWTAPTPRFANAIFWLLSISSSLILLTYLQRVICKHLFILSFIVIFAVTNIVSFGYFLIYYDAIGDVSLSGWYPMQKYPLTVQTTESGLAVYMPINGDQCGDSPLPCTPYFNAELRLRDRDNIVSGFTVQP
jgi:hypothetical protein